MSRLAGWWSRLRATLSPARGEAHLDDELESHLQLDIDERVRRGATPEVARREALLAMGGLEPTKERVRDQARLRGLENLVVDVRFALRTLVEASPVQRRRGAQLRARHRRQHRHLRRRQRRPLAPAALPRRRSPGDVVGHQPPQQRRRHAGHAGRLRRLARVDALIRRDGQLERHYLRAHRRRHRPRA